MLGTCALWELLRWYLYRYDTDSRVFFSNLGDANFSVQRILADDTSDLNYNELQGISYLVLHFVERESAGNLFLFWSSLSEDCSV